jgi:hypothetical protein
MAAGREVIARKGVYPAMGRELQSVILEAKSKAGQFKSLPAFGSWNRTSLSVGRDRPHVRLSLLGTPARSRKPAQQGPLARGRAARLS